LARYLLAAFAVLLLAVAPGVIRRDVVRPKWVLFRVGARPAGEDRDQRQARNVQRKLVAAGREASPPGVVVADVWLCVTRVVAPAMEPVWRSGRLWRAGPPVESGVGGSVWGRGPPGGRGVVWAV
jgi:hypothetical protein